MALRLCDAFVYGGAATSPPLNDYGKPVSCGLYGNTVVGAVEGNPQPGILACGAPATDAVIDVSKYCGFYPGDSPVSGRWQFVPLPVASGPVDSATFATAAGTACLTVGMQSFTFTLATMAMTPGCGAQPAATATP